MHIAVIGAGFCGLAAAWFLQNILGAKITIFDEAGIGKGASGVAAGLLHPYAGAHAKRNWKAVEGMTATLELVKVAERFIDHDGTAHSSIKLHQGLLRPAISEEQTIDYKRCADAYADVHWHFPAQCQKDVAGMLPLPGVYIETALTIDCASYLRGLWNACKYAGASLIIEKIKSLSALREYDYIIVTAGAATKHILELADMPITPVKGQVLECTWPDDLPPLPYPLNSQAYLLMNASARTCIAGSTFERDFFDEYPDANQAVQEIFPKIHAFFPSLHPKSIIECRAGLRASTPGHRPFLKKISSRCWVLTGMGSKGLLYHALYAKELVDAIAKDIDK